MLDSKETKKPKQNAMKCNRAILDRDVPSFLICRRLDVPELHGKIASFYVIITIF
jgi:hypothetical protein